MDDDWVEGPGAPICWRTVVELQAGMVLARPAVGTQGGRATLLIGAGAVLGESTIAQLIARGVDCVAVFAAPLEDSVQAERQAAHEARLREIFGGDGSHGGCAGLLAAMCKLGPCRC